MKHRPIIDAGPGLNFLSINQERLLIGILGPLSAPEVVASEVLRKSATDARFRSAATTWRKLTPKWIQILSDDTTPELARAVHRMTRMPMNERLGQSKDLGETMVTAHAVVAAEAGAHVFVLIDDGSGARTAALEGRRLDRLRAGGRSVGSIRLISTLTVLERAAKTPHIPDKAEMREIYRRLRLLDDGLAPIERTDLLSPLLWKADL